MKCWMTCLILAAAIFQPVQFTMAQGPSDQSGAPYFTVIGEGMQADPLPLKSTRADVTIAGVIAQVAVTQVYQNVGKAPIEAVYVFPGATRSAVHAMTMTIGKRVIRAVIQERGQARETYETAKAAGKRASLLEQQRPNVFQMNVANILPGDRIEVVLEYTELLAPRNKIYQFTYPVVVGPRYTDGSQPDMQWNQNPYLAADAPVPYDFDVTVKLAAGLPIQAVSCASHDVDITYQGPRQATVGLTEHGKTQGDRDFILSYQLAGARVETGLLLYQDPNGSETENFFLLMVQPPKQIKPADVLPREYLFVVDVSGSMRGFPLEISKKLLTDLIGRLRPSDRFNILFFAGGSSVLAPHSLPATSINLQKAIQMIDHQRGGGGTQLLPALQRAFDLNGIESSVQSPLSRTIVVITDGYVGVELKTFDLIRNRLGDANLFAFGIGSSVNRFLIEGMARAGMGEPFIITQPAHAEKTAQTFIDMIQTPALTQIAVTPTDWDISQLAPRSVPDVLADRPVLVFGKWSGKLTGNIRVSGRTGQGSFEQTIDLASVKPSSRLSALKYLWARQRIAELSDDFQIAPSDARAQEVTALGLKYHLLTQWTSFVAVDTAPGITDGQPTTTVRQPLPLPHGVPESAIGGMAVANRSLSFSMPKMAMQPGAPPSQADTAMELAAPVSPEKTKISPTTAMWHIAQVRVIQGVADIAHVRQVLRTAMHALHACLAAYFPAGADEPVLRLQLDAGGHVTAVALEGNAGKIDAVKRCLDNCFKNVTFRKMATPALILFKLGPSPN